MMLFEFCIELFPQGTHCLQTRRAFELIGHRQARVGIKHGLTGLVVVAAFDRDGLAVHKFLASLLDEYAEDGSLAFGGQKVATRPSLRAEAGLEGDSDTVSLHADLLVRT